MTIPATATGVSELLVARNADLWDKMARHPWVKALAAGSLPDEALITWAAQDRLFLGFERDAVRILQAGRPDPPLDELYDSLIRATYREPGELARTLDSLGAAVADEPWPACAGYGAYLVNSARAGLVEGTAAIWAAEHSYHATFTAVRPSVRAESRWRSWVEIWSGDAFGERVTALGQCLDDLVANPSDLMLERLDAVVRLGLKWELEFWEMSWTSRDWVADRP